MLTEILYAFSSATGNNGSAFAGLSGNTNFYNLMLAGAMWAGRYLFLIPVMAMAGNLVKKKIVPASAGTFPTDGPLFVALLIGTIIIVAASRSFPPSRLDRFSSTSSSSRGTDMAIASTRTKRRRTSITDPELWFPQSVRASSSWTREPWFAIR